MYVEGITPEVVKQLEMLKLHARRAFLGQRQGGHLSLKRGHGIEFSDYRKYELGDNPRHIDWGVYGRTDRLYVKRFQEEQDITLFLLLDCSESMVGQATPEKGILARQIAFSLGYIALMNQDGVIVAVPGAPISPRFQGPQATHRISHYLMEHLLSPQEHYLQDAHQAIHQARFPGIGVFISDLLMPFHEIESILAAMRAKNLDISIVHLMAERDRNPLGDASHAAALDVESGERFEVDLSGERLGQYQAAYTAHIHKVRSYALGSGIHFSTVDLRTQSDHLLREAVLNTGIVR